MHYSHICLVFALIGIATLTVAVPARQVRAADGPQDYHWRLITGIKATRQHMNRLEDQKCATGVDTTLQESYSDFTAILDEICDLLSFYDMVNSVSESEGKDLLKLLKQNMIDACEWTKHIATTTPHASYSGEFNCDTPDFLRKRCIATRAKRGSWLHQKLSATYSKSNDFVDVVLSGDHVENANEETWIGHFIDSSDPLTCSA